MSILSNQEYEANEIRQAHADQARIERASLADRQEAARNFYRVMSDDPATVAERLGWLFDGNYGKGQQLTAQAIIKRSRMNRAAALTTLVAAFEWQCPANMAIAAWKKLTKQQKQMLDDALQIVIRAAEREGE
jgi:hypothetical protein